MYVRKWTVYILLCTVVNLGYGNAATTVSVQDARKISVTNWIRIITHPPTTNTNSDTKISTTSGLFHNSAGTTEATSVINSIAPDNDTTASDWSGKEYTESSILHSSIAPETPGAARVTRMTPPTENATGLPLTSSLTNTGSTTSVTTFPQGSNSEATTQDWSGEKRTHDSTLYSTIATETETPVVAMVTRMAPSPVTQNSSSADQVVTDFRQMLGLLQRAGGLLPEVRDALMAGQPLTSKQTKMLLDLARQFGATLSSLPDSIQGANSTLDLMKLLADSGLLQSLTNISIPSSGMPRQDQEVGASSQPHTVHWLKCRADLLAMAAGLGNGQTWALQMLDSWGKPESSILRGNLAFLGNNAECRNVHYTNTTTFADIQGNMCRMDIKLESMRSAMFGGQIVPIKFDVCLPRSCESVDLNSALSDSGLPYITMSCTADLDIGDDPWAIVAVIVLSIFLSLMVAGTLTEFCIMSKTGHKSDFINAFISNTSNSAGNPDYVNNGVNGIKTNGAAGIPHGYINGGFEMRETGYIVSESNSKLSAAVHQRNGTKNGSSAVRGISETTLDAADNKNSRLLNGDYTDDLPNYPYAKVSHHNGKMADLYIADSAPPIQPTADDQRKPKTSTSADETAHLPKWQRLLLAFSLPRNTGKILGVKAGPGSIACLHGIRVLSLGWVIFGHTLSFAGQFGNFQNKLDMFELTRDFTFQVMANGTLSVDSFFFMSGLLTAYMFLKECGKQEKVTIKQGIMYYVHRYWRLTPPMAIWIMVVACLVQYVGEGRPGWVDYPGAQLCRNDWWVNLLYIQNIWDERAGCLGVTWYLANDMQFYFLAPLALIPWVYKKQILGFVMAILLVIVHLVSNAWLVYEYNFDIFRPGEGYMQKLYIKPWARVGPFAIGLIMGYILWKTKSKMHINKYLVAIGWFFAMAAMLTVTLVTYDENKDPINDPDGWPVGGKLVHETFSRPVWALILSWIVLACSTGHGGFVNSILSWEGFLPLSRMTYCAYLIHMTIMGYEFMGADSTFLYTMTNLIYRFFGMYVMSYAVAFLLAVGVEAPMLGLEKVALAR